MDRSRLGFMSTCNFKFAETNFRTISPRFAPEAIKVDQGLIDLLNDICERKKATPAQFALACLLAKKYYLSPIPGTTKISRMEENAAAADIELAAQDVEEIESAASKVAGQGERHPLISRP